MHRGVARLANVKMGYEMPTIENKEGMGGNFRGFLHHFWVFTVSNGRVVGVPKSPLLEEAFYDLNGMVDTVLMKNYGEINLQVRRAERNETIRVHVALVARLVILLHNSLFLSSPPLSLVNTLFNTRFARAVDPRLHGRSGLQFGLPLEGLRERVRRDGDLRRSPSQHNHRS